MNLPLPEDHATAPPHRAPTAFPELRVVGAAAEESTRPPETAPPASTEKRPLLYQSPAMHEVVTQAQRFATTRASVLVTGESGTGKELIAHLIHTASPRRHETFAKVNCAALSDALVESELFGHERGAFTGAQQRRIGRIEWAAGGTLLLDEISEISPAIQAKLLRVLEENEFQRVGSNESLHSDVRIIATTNRRLTHEIRSGNFRADLYFRLSVLELHIPPLRERRDDIPLLCNYFAHCFSREAPLAIRGVAAETLRKLIALDWPGNVRQLRNVVYRGCVLAEQPLLGDWILDGVQSADVAAQEPLPDWLLNSPWEKIERQIITQALRLHKNKIAEVAHRLGLSAKTISNKLRTYRESGFLP